MTDRLTDKGTDEKERKRLAGWLAGWFVYVNSLPVQHSAGFHT